MNKEEKLLEYKHIVINLANKYIKQYPFYKNDYEDFYQEGMIGLSEAINKYDSNLKASFTTFAYICIRAKMNNWFRKNLNNNILEIKEETEEEFESPSYIENDIVFMNLKDKLKEYKFNLSLDDSQIFELYINDFNSREISELLEINQKRVEYKILKIKKDLVKEDIKNYVGI